MLAHFRTYIRSSNGAGQAGLWFVYGVGVVVAWLARQFSKLVRYATTALVRWTFTGSLIAIMVKVGVVAMLLGIVIAQSVDPFLGANFITLGACPVVLAAFGHTIKRAFKTR